MRLVWYYRRRYYPVKTVGRHRYTRDERQTTDRRRRERLARDISLGTPRAAERVFRISPRDTFALAATRWYTTASTDFDLETRSRTR